MKNSFNKTNNIVQKVLRLNDLDSLDVDSKFSKEYCLFLNKNIIKFF